MDIIKSNNPDVLNCLANLSNDQVFTPTNIAKKMLDELPKKIWSDPDLKILDPVCKTGIFLREAAERLNEGLKNKIKNDQKRINHILKNQIFGIATTEIASLIARRSIYYSKDSNGKYSACKIFKDAKGNILYSSIKHEWKNGKCLYCGAAQTNRHEDFNNEQYASEFIHTENVQELFPNMKFDVIIGNPPYQISAGGHSRSASTIYHLFVENAKKLNPRYLSMIIPSRWFIGGKGLDKFRKEMLNDKRVKKIVDYESSSDVFSGPEIAGGVSYFLWEKNYAGKCEFTSVRKSVETQNFRDLNEFDVLIRDTKALNIIKKIQKLKINNDKRLSEVVSPRKAFNLSTNYTPKNSGLPCWYIQKIGKKFANKTDVTDSNKLLNKWKFLVPKAPIAGQTDFSKPVGFYYDGNTIIAKPGECCTESWIVAGAFDTEKEARNFKSYLFTKVARFLLLQSVISQDVTRKNFVFVPNLENYNKQITDDYLIKKFEISKNDWAYIDSRITKVKNG